MSASSSQRPLYERGNIRITRTLLKYQNTQYLIRDIYRISRIAEPFEAPPSEHLIFIFLFAIMFAVFLRIALWLIFIIGGAIALFKINARPMTRYTLIVNLKQGDEVRISTTDLQEMNYIQKALEQAIDIVSLGQYFIQPD